MINEKCLYFRKVSSLGADDGADDSAMFPVSKFKGLLYANASNLMVFYFYGMHDYNTLSLSTGQEDSVSISITADAKARVFINALTDEIHTGTSPVIVVFDEVDDSSFLTGRGLSVSSYINNINTISVNTD